MGGIEKRVKISQEIDITAASFEAIKLAEKAGFNRVKQSMVGTSVSELARNIYLYAFKGEVTVRILKRGNKNGIEIVAKDNGPGIPDLAMAMKDSFSTSDGLGLGLPGVKRMMDEFTIDSKSNVGTKVTARKWS